MRKLHFTAVLLQPLYQACGCTLYLFFQFMMRYWLYQKGNNIVFCLLSNKFFSVLFLLKEKVPKSSSTDDLTTHPCTRPDWAFALLWLQLQIPDKMRSRSDAVTSAGLEFTTAVHLIQKKVKKKKSRQTWTLRASCPCQRYILCS